MLIIINTYVSQYVPRIIVICSTQDMIRLIEYPVIICNYGIVLLKSGYSIGLQESPVIILLQNYGIGIRILWYTEIDNNFGRLEDWKILG